MPRTGSSTASVLTDRLQRTVTRIAASPIAAASANCRKTSNNPVLREKEHREQDRVHGESCDSPYYAECE